MSQEQSSDFRHKSFLMERFWFWAGVASLAVAGLAGAAWLARKPLIEAAAGAALRSNGAEGSLIIEAAGPDSVIARDVRIGPVGAPALTARRVTIGYRLDPARGQMVIERLDLEGVSLFARVTPDGLDLGALAPLLEPRNGPARVRLENARLNDGRLTLATPRGDLVLAAQGAAGVAAGGRGRLVLLAAPAAILPAYAPGAVTADIAAGPAGPMRALRAVIRAQDMTFVARNVRGERVSGAITLATALPVEGAPQQVEASGVLAAQTIVAGPATAAGVRLSVRRLEVNAQQADWRDVAVRLDSRLEAGMARGGGWRGEALSLDGVARRAAGDALHWSGAARAALVTGPEQISATEATLALTAQRARSGAVTGAWRVALDTLRAPQGAGERLSAFGPLKLAWPAVRDPARISGGMPFTLAVASARPARTVARAIGVQARSAPAPANAALLALARAAEGGASLSAAGALDLDGRGGAMLTLDAAQARSGAALARLTPASPAAIRADIFGGRVSAAGRLDIAGGGLPSVDVSVDALQASGGAVTASGVARIAPFAAGGARASVERLAFVVRGPAAAPRVSLAGRAALSGAFAGGRLDGAELAFDLEAGGGGVRLLGCTQATLAGFAQGDVSIGPARARLCPQSGGLRIDARGIAGAATLAVSPFAITTGDGGRTMATLDTITLEARQGGALAFSATPKSVTTLPDGETIAAQAGLAGVFDPGASRTWRLDARTDTLDAAAFGTRLSGAGALRAQGRDGRVTGALEQARLTLVDTLATERFGPVQADGALALDAAGVAGRFALATTNGKPLGTADITHRFAEGTGEAAIALDQLGFTRRGLQPDQLFPALKGIVAEMEGALDATVALRWGGGAPFAARATVATARLDFATGLGPVERVSGAVEISDLLALTSPPGQTLTIGRFNPGVPIEAGLFQFSLPGGPRVQIEDARWPFAGGVMTLKPDLWDIGAPRQTLTMELSAVDLQSLVELLRIPDLQTAGTVEGAFPVIVEAGVARIEGGRLRARAGGGLIRYTGAAAEAAAQGGPGPRLAFDALRNLEFELLEITVDGPLTGELTIGLLFQGKNPDVMDGYPFRFNVKAKGPFAQLAQALGGIQRQGQAIGEQVRDMIELRQTGPASPTPPPPTGQSQTPPAVDPRPPPVPN